MFRWFRFVRVGGFGGLISAGAGFVSLVLVSMFRVLAHTNETAVEILLWFRNFSDFKIIFTRFPGKLSLVLSQFRLRLF